MISNVQSKSQETSMMSTQITFSPDEIESLHRRAGTVIYVRKRFEQSTTLFGIVISLLEQSGHKPARLLQASPDKAIDNIRHQFKIGERTHLAIKKILQGIVGHVS